MSFLSNRGRRLGLLTAVGLLAGGVAPDAAAQDGKISLRIDGNAGTRFSATCRLKSAGGEEAIMIDKKVPFQATFEGSGLRCEIIAPSTIEVEAVKGGSRSMSSGNSINVNVGS